MGVPTWLLIDYDWAATKQAAPFVPHCSDIVILPRLKWIEDSKDTGKHNHAWYRFDIRHKGGPVRQNNRGGEAIAAQRCEECHRAYRSQRSSSRFSSETCRQRAHRKKVGVTLASGFAIMWLVATTEALVFVALVFGMVALAIWAG